MNKSPALLSFHCSLPTLHMLHSYLLKSLPFIEYTLFSHILLFSLSGMPLPPLFILPSNSCLTFKILQVFLLYKSFLLFFFPSEFASFPSPTYKSSTALKILFPENYAKAGSHSPMCSHGPTNAAQVDN